MGGRNVLDMRHSIAQQGEVVVNERGYIVLGVGDTVPTDTTANFEVGCLWIDTNAADGATLLINEGTATSCDFNALLGGLDMSELTATAAELNARAAKASRIVNVTDAATYTVLAADSGKIHIFPDLTQSCTLALPAVSSGLEYTFIGKGVAADASHWIFQSASATNFFLGGVGFVDTDDPADTVVAVYSNGSSNDFLTVNAPGAGTRIHLVCDGTNWIANGIVVGATAPAFSDT